ncbi:hypothetical protein TRIATDRAFT_88909 [Trichoderma atroviride IMI 206040]|uniref:Uncharacterized protein n=1 Tax=Hypocrea atroviridis (strain ATCC 20476 / IMI 206040) TaxID=452589 RepID=G9NUF9_HYPAI|nr:uncharacterized protein TRIATDRAFT_88909 [Trichoderma atroviride IMI 206040]EHK45690.1 hypothetical protein TRIATDRAFT_88909 [Trichoderma atroviride IMI 206040]
MRTGACLAGSGPCGGTGTRATGRPRGDGALARGTCVVGEKTSVGRYFAARALEFKLSPGWLYRPISTWVQQQKRQPTPALSAAQRQHQHQQHHQQQQQHDDTTRYDTTQPVAAAAIVPHLAIAMAQHHRHRPPSRPQQRYLASHCLVCGMTKVSFVVRTQAARRVLSQIRRPRRPLYGPSYQGMATSVKVVALDLSLALALPNRAVHNEAKGLNLVPSI